MSNTIVPTDKLGDYVGKVIGTSDWFPVTQERINAFADATDDWQFIHLDQEKAKDTPFGGTIAHGFLTLSLLTPMLSKVNLVPEGLKMAVNYGFNKVRFIAPVPSGSNIRATVKLDSVEEKRPGEFMMVNTITVDIEGSETPALIAEWITMAFTD